MGFLGLIGFRAEKLCWVSRVSGLGLRTCVGLLQGLGFLMFRILGLMCLRYHKAPQITRSTSRYFMYLLTKNVA